MLPPAIAFVIQDLNSVHPGICDGWDSCPTNDVVGENDVAGVFVGRMEGVVGDEDELVIFEPPRN